MSERSKNTGNRLKKLGAVIAVPMAAFALSSCTSANHAPTQPISVTTPDTREKPQPAFLELAPAQIEQVHTAARGTALATMRSVRGSQPDKYNGYGQLMFTQADVKNDFGQAVWVRAYKAVNGTEFHVELATFQSPSGSLENPADTKTLVSQGLSFINPATDVFEDGMLTSEEATAVFKDTNTQFVGGSKEVDNVEQQAAFVTLDGSTVTAKMGDKVTSYDSDDNPVGVSTVQDPSQIKDALEWVINKV